MVGRPELPVEKQLAWFFYSRSSPEPYFVLGTLLCVA